jgi:hypothetical protein
MLRTTRLIASALFVISVSVLSTRVGYGGDEVNPCPGGGPPVLPCLDLGKIEVVGVQMRSGCPESLGREYWIQVKNTSVESSFRVKIERVVFSGVPTAPAQIALCTETNTSTKDVAPDQCANWAGVPFFNGPPRPCDSKCCKGELVPPVPVENCNTPLEPYSEHRRGCTQIQKATVKVIAYKPNHLSGWYSLKDEPTACEIVNGEPGDGYPALCKVINVCDPGPTGAENPYYQNWNLQPCSIPGL